MSLFPNVPNLPGVPPLARSALTAISTVQGLVSAVGNTLQFFKGKQPGPLWGVYDSSMKSVVTADSFLSFRNKRSTKLADFPIQDGAFASFNKVAIPYNAFIRISRGGSVTDRADLYAQLDALIDSLQLYQILTPEKTFLSVNMEDYEIVRESNKDAYFFTQVDLSFREIRPVVAVYTTTDSAPDLTDAKQAAASPSINQGVVVPTVPSAAIQNAATTAVAGGLNA